MKRLTMSDINAYLDGALDEDERREVELVLRTDTEAAVLLQQYRQQVRELHRIYDKVLTEPVPPKMLEMLQRRKPGQS
jgi:anti-sigma factor RsiW